MRPTCKAAVLLCAALLLLSHAPLRSQAEADVSAQASDASSASGLPTPKQRPGAQEFTFQAEVNRLMDIIIHSLYSNKDVFLRELISNACDAMDKIRFLSLTDASVLGEGDNTKLEVQISLDQDNNILFIRDRGIGMTRDDLIKNLGTIAKSGTSAFLEQMQKGGDVNLIGQFGVGFYSAYLVADWVEVISKHNDDKQYIWSSTADGSFNIVEDTENEPLGRGTLIKLHLKPEAVEYAQEYKLKELIKRYSEFMNFPIYFQTEKEVEVPVEEEAEEEATEEAPAEATEEGAKEEEEGAAKEGEDGVSDEEGEEEEEEEEPQTRKEKQKVWELVNDSKAIWLRQPSDVTKEEYEKFYKAVSRHYDQPLTWTHFKAEGDVEFKTVMFIPQNAPHGFYDKYYEKDAQTALKLYVRRVFITDSMTDLLPRYMTFVRGIVDSDTLPLSVSRETLQAHSALKTIKKKLARKVLDMVKKMAEDEQQCQKQEEEEKAKQEAAKEKAEADAEGGQAEEAETSSETSKLSEEDCKRYSKFWTAYGKAIKLGIIEDTNNRNRLAKLLRVQTTKTDGKTISLDEYVARMKDGQAQIYYITGQSVDELKRSPFVERLLKKEYEVILFTDVLDEYVMGHLLDYDDKKFADVSKEDLRMSDKDEKEKKRDKELKEEFKDLTKWWKKTVGEDVSNVKVSNRLSSTPCVVVVSKYSQSANMLRITKAQAFHDPTRSTMHKGQRILEINPRHPLIRGLNSKVLANEEDETAVTVAKLLWETALLESGFELEDSKAFSQRIYGLVKDTVGLEEPLDAVEEEVDEPEEETPAEEEEPVEESDEYEDPAEVKTEAAEGEQEQAAAEQAAKEEL